MAVWIWAVDFRPRRRLLPHDCTVDNHILSHRQSRFSLNGHSEAPPGFGGASSVERPRTRSPEFPADLPIDTLSSLYYAGRRFLLGGAPPSRYVSICLLICAAVWATGIVPGRWAGFALAMAALAAHILIGVTLKRRDYVTVRGQSLPNPLAEKLSVETLLPVYVTGALSVEGSHRRFTCLPGFYRTYATREHALLCLVRSRKLLRFLRWPEDEAGMWYAFLTAESIRSVTYGVLEFGREPMTAIAVDYELCIDSERRFSKSSNKKCGVERLVVSASSSDVIHAILADLCADGISFGQESVPRLDSSRGKAAVNDLAQRENTDGSPT